MSSKDEDRIPVIDQDSSILELIKYVKHSFRECEFNEVQNILMDREKKFKTQIKNLIRDRDSAKEETSLLERAQGLAEFEKLKLEEKLQKCERQCEKMKETNKRLNEEQRVSSDKAKMAEKRYDIAMEENLKIAKEKNELICELNEKLDQLKNRNLENERLVGVYQEKLKSLDMRLIEYEQAKLYESGLQLRVTKVEAALANILNVKVEDLGNLADILEAAANGENVCPPDISEGGNDIVANGNANADVEYMAVVSHGVHSTSNSTGSAGIGLPNKVHSTSNSTGSAGIGLPNKDCRNLVPSFTKVKGIDTACTSTGTQSGRGHVESDVAAQHNEVEGSLVSGPHPDGGLPIREKSHSVDIIEISDSDDEWKPVDATHTSDHSNKRNNEDSTINLITKRKRRIFISDGEDVSPIDEKENQVLESSHRRIDVDSEDESCTDSHMEDLVATLRSKCNGT